MTETQTETTTASAADADAFDLPVLAGLLDESVPKVTAALPGLPLMALVNLRALEEGGKTRSTLIDAIDAEIAPRPIEDVAGREGFSRADVDLLVGSAREVAVSEALAPLMARVGQLDEGFSGSAADLVDRAIELLTPPPVPVGEAVDLGQTARKPAKALTIADGSEAPGLVALTGGSSIVLVDVDNVPVAGLGPIEAAPDAFTPNGDEVIYMRDIEPPLTLGRTEIGGAFLLDAKGDPVAKAVLAPPFAIGGGRPSNLKARTLSFAKPASALDLANADPEAVA